MSAVSAPRRGAGNGERCSRSGAPPREVCPFLVWESRFVVRGLALSSRIRLLRCVFFVPFLTKRGHYMARRGVNRVCQAEAARSLTAGHS